MGFFKSMKDMKDMVHEAPGLIDQSNQLAANAQAMAAAQQAAAVQAQVAAAPAAAAVASAEGDFAPIAGVTLEVYAAIAASFAEVAYDQSRGPELAARKGVTAEDWEAALEGWNARITLNPAVAKRFNALYMGR